MDLLRFRGLAKDAKAFEVLKEIEDRGTERAREKAKRILPMMRAGGDGEEDNRLDFDGVFESGGFALSSLLFQAFSLYYFFFFSFT